MKHIVIAGTSGVGKTFLEEYLESQRISFQLPKYFDRPNRPEERKDKNVSMSSAEWMQIRDEFFFTLRYGKYNYGWKRSDIKKDKVSTLAITLESLEAFMQRNADFIPILLWVNIKHLVLLKQRMAVRGDRPEVIDQRLTLAREEIKHFHRYRVTVEKYHGLVVQIEDNLTIYKETIPYIRTLFTPSRS